MRILLPNTVSLSILSSRLFYIPTLRLKLIFSFSLGFLSKEFFASSKPGASTPLPPCWVPLGKDSFACQHKKDSYEVVWIHISSCFFWSTARRSACCFYLLLSSCKTCKRLSHIKNLACDAERLLYLAAGLWPCAKQQCHFFLQQIQVRPSPSPLRWRPHLPQWAWNSPWSPALFWWPSSFLKPVNHLSNFCQTFVICQSVDSCPWHDPLRKLWSTSSTSIWFIELKGIVLSVLSVLSMLFWDCDFSQPKAASAWAELQLNSILYSLVFNSGRGHLILGISRKNAFALYSCLLHLD